MSESSSENGLGDDQTPPPQAKSKRPRATKRQRAWWSVRAIGLLVFAPVLMLLIAAVLLIDREVTAPSWIVRDVEARAEQVLAGGALDFGAMKITVGRDLHPRLVLENAVLRDKDGATVASVPRITGQLSPRGVLQGRILAQEIGLTGAQVSLRRSEDGTVAFAFDQGAESVVAASGFVDLLEQIDQTFEEGALEALETVQAEGLIINYVDARAKRSWVVDGGRVGLDLRGGELELRADVALLSGRSYVTTAELTYRSPRGRRSADIGLAITDAAAPDIASQSPLLAFLGVLDAPISGAVRGTIDDDGMLDSTSATLQIGAGELQPNAQTRPIPFQSARTYLSYDPLAESLRFDLIEIDSDWGRAVGTAQTYLREFRNGWPEALLGQVQLSELSVAPDDLYENPVDVVEASADFRLRLDPFTLDIGQAVAVSGDTPVHVSGQVRAATDGWSVALDAQTDVIGTAQVIDLWPQGMAPRTRTWLSENIDGGTLRDAHIAFRARPQVDPTFALSLEYRDAQVRFLRTLPPISNARGALSIIDRRMALTLDAGHVVAPEGGRIEMAGSTMVIPRTGIPNAPAQFDLALQSRVTAAMSILSQPPFNVLRSSDLPVDFAQGRAAIEVSLSTPLGRDIAPEDRDWSATAQVRDVRTTVLVPNQTITSSALQVSVDKDSLVVQGPARMGTVAGTATFSRALGAGSEGTARLEADVAVGPALLEAFNVTLPRGMVTGEAPARLSVNLADPLAATFRLTSDLRGVGLNLAAVGWSKARGASGGLTVTGQLGATPRIDELSLSGPGLDTTGTVRIAPGGGLERAAFENVALGGWLNAPVVLLGQGRGRPVAVQIAGGSLDLRSANFGTTGAGGGGTQGQGGPMEVALDRLRVTDSIEITDFRGNFSTAGGFQGDFRGNVNGTAPIRGSLVPVQGRSAVRIVSNDAGSLMRATGLLRTAQGGDVSVTLVPTGVEGTYDGTVVGSQLRVRDAPALASLLDAISVVGLLTQLDGQGLLFSDLDAQFRLSPNQVIVTQSSAVGPGLGLSLDGVYSTQAQVLDFQGVVSPFYLLNGIGSVLTRPGEGFIGFNFNLRGPVDNPQVLVNPLSALTPGMFRDIFRRPPPTLDQ